jgi:NADPH-dependent 2,4-dienoyl-CoA reductase/sulfur reductase-like enzyme
MIVIAGGGLAAQRCCERLRRKGYEGRIVMVCEESHAPYDRPPLSKQFLAGTMTDPPRLRPDAWYEDSAVELLLGDGAAALRADAHELELRSGRRLRYERLLIATGAAPRLLPGCEGFDNVHVLRTLADAERLRGGLRPGASLVVIGAGFIGQEVASTARSVGADVTLVEALPAPLANVVGVPIGEWFTRLHRAHGVEVRAAAPFESLAGNGRATRVELATGGAVECDEVVVGIGVTPATAWLAGTAIGPNGTTAIRADHAGRTSIPDVYAAGDCAGSQHWEAAVQQGAAAALAMLGDSPPAPPPAGFWSDLYGIRINWLGDARDADSFAIDGDEDANDFSVIYRRNGTPIAGLLVGRPRALPELRQLLNSRKESE